MSQPPIDVVAFREFERLGHNRLADSYSKRFVPITRHAIEPLLDAAAVGRGTRVLDVATGTGVVAAAAATRGAQAVGVDIAPRMLEIAAGLNPELEFREAPAESLPYADRVFGAVVSNFGVGHFADPKRAVAECVRVLASAGRLALSWWDVPTGNRLQGVFVDALNEAGVIPPPAVPVGPPVFQFSDDDALAGLLGSARLGELAVRRVAFTLHLSDGEELWTCAMGSFVRTSAAILGQTAEMQSQIRSAFDRLVSAYAMADGIALPVAFKIASGRNP
ncbi:MAG TPA: class I SAM-dependent methyltransferase [Burkholderiales bacterium]|nr:class I SAM-dependent methyltransferase [Burkholderiales bacterium]